MSTFKTWSTSHSFCKAAENAVQRTLPYAEILNVHLFFYWINVETSSFPF